MAKGWAGYENGRNSIANAQNSFVRIRKNFPAANTEGTSNICARYEVKSAQPSEGCDLMLEVRVGLWENRVLSLVYTVTSGIRVFGRFGIPIFHSQGYYQADSTAKRYPLSRIAPIAKPF